MSRPDFNLLVTLDVLLAEGSVARAARRLHLSPSAMSRALARLRETTGDPLLVRAGRGLVPTPRALALRSEVARLVQDAEAVLRPAADLDLARLARTFTIRSSEGFVENFGPSLIAHLADAAPGVRLHFLPKCDKDNAPLREGAVDLETGVIGATSGPELCVQALFRDRFVGVVRAGHPVISGEPTVACFAAGRHVSVSRRGRARGPIDEALKAQGLERSIATVVGGFSTALALVRSTDLIATVPERHTGNLRSGLHTFRLPMPLEGITVSQFWHPRLDADPAHRWLRGCVRDLCAPLRDPSDSTR